MEIELRDSIIPEVLINSWEAAYFDIDANKLIGLAKESASSGIELLVMDDGWFGKRDDDNSGLGDWFVNEEKQGIPVGYIDDHWYATSEWNGRISGISNETDCRRRKMMESMFWKAPEQRNG